MRKYSFLLEHYDDMQDRHCDFFDDVDDLETTKGNTSLVLKAYRIVIPEIHASFREGGWYEKNENADADDDDAWEAQGFVCVRYDENEKDVANYQSIVMADLETCVREVCSENSLKIQDQGKLKCFLDTDKIKVDVPPARKVLATFRESCPEIFQIFEEEKYTPHVYYSYPGADPEIKFTRGDREYFFYITDSNSYGLKLILFQGSIFNADRAAFIQEVKEKTAKLFNMNGYARVIGRHCSYETEITSDEFSERKATRVWEIMEQKILASDHELLEKFQEDLADITIHLYYYDEKDRLLTKDFIPFMKKRYNLDWMTT